MKIGDESGMDPRGSIGNPGEPRRRHPPLGMPRAVEPGVARRARALARLLGRVDEAGLDPMRAAHVEILRNAVATGRYQPDLHDVARKLLAEMAAGSRPRGRRRG